MSASTSPAIFLAVASPCSISSWIAWRSSVWLLNACASSTEPLDLALEDLLVIGQDLDLGPQLGQPGRLLAPAHLAELLRDRRPEPRAGLVEEPLLKVELLAEPLAARVALGPDGCRECDAIRLPSSAIWSLIWPTPRPSRVAPSTTASEISGAILASSTDSSTASSTRARFSSAWTRESSFFSCASSSNTACCFRASVCWLSDPTDSASLRRLARFSVSFS